jgi:biopolymer transport protein TolR
MAGSLGPVGKGRGRYRPMAEINVTPLVDVMLVLLIVFMVTAPLITSGVNVTLPSANAQPVHTDAQPIQISVNASNEVFLDPNTTPIPLNTLVAALQQSASGDHTRQIFVRGDQTVAYGEMLQVMATISDGGFTKVALLAKHPDH